MSPSTAAVQPHAWEGMRIGRGFLGRIFLLFVVASVTFSGFYAIVALSAFVQTKIVLLFFPNETIADPVKTPSPKPSDRPLLIFDANEVHRKLHTGFYYFQHCAYKNCFLTNSESHANHADAVIFSEYSSWHLPSPRPSGQVWILRLLESPQHTMSLKNFDNQVNFTASYRSDADFHTPYGVFTKSSHSSSTLMSNVNKGKSKMVAWSVSNCFTKNNRMSFARELNRHIQVDIYGSCSKRAVSKTRGAQLLKEQYRFYLSFENSNCKEYITEKLWENAYRNSIIPVVMGAPRSDYEKWTPPNSFIHVDDFRSAAELAEYLLKVAADDDLYNSYFSWKQIGYLRDSGFYCNLCERLQNPEFKVYTDLDSWWFRNDQCEAPKLVWKH